MLLSAPTTRWTARSLPTRLTLNIALLRFSSSTSESSASATTSAKTVATSFLSRFQTLGPQTRTQTLDANQLRLLSLTLNRPTLFPTSPHLSQTTSSTTTTTTEIEDGTPLPAGYHLAYFTPAFTENELGADGTDTSYNPAHPFTRRMWAGGEVSWPRDGKGNVNTLRIGQMVTETTRVLSAEAKVVRKTGEEMIVVGVEKEFSNEGGVAVVDRRNWVFRKALPPPSQSTINTQDLPPPTPPSSSPASIITTSSTDGLTHTRTLRQTAVTLFRFSALTFNPHKIHYSQPWCREVEGHKDIVVHGPLNLIAILDFWRDIRGAGDVANAFLPERIAYRATSPLYAEDEYRIVLKQAEKGSEDGDKSAIEILTPEGNVGMKAEVVGV
ncbi:hypothetical protein BDW74DRAFT_177742 [Aspergillus multicolor]|uniref:hydroxyacyl-thioester dehydratase HTD2 n=1 Tax=Aspergillus multicolor TaxID=41759 RepID=UPI003CCD27CE